MQKNQRIIILAAALSGALAVFLGAFGAHALKNMVGTEMLAVWESAVRYQFIHTLAIMIAFALAPKQKFTHWACLLFLAGILIFSGSLYALVLSEVKILGAVTPIGGVLLILGWLSLAVAFAKNRLAE